MKRLISLFVLFGFGLATVLSSAYAYDKQGFGPAEASGHVIIMTQDLQSDFSKDSIMLINTSSKDAFAAKHIKGSVTMSMDDIALQMEEGSLDGKTLFLINTDHLAGKTSGLGMGISLLLYALAVAPAGINELVGNMFELLGIPVNMNRPLDFLPPLYGSYFADLNIGSRDSFSHSAEDAGFQMFALPVDTLIDTIADESNDIALQMEEGSLDGKTLFLLNTDHLAGETSGLGLGISLLLYALAVAPAGINELVGNMFELLGIPVNMNRPLDFLPPLYGSYFANLNIGSRDSFSHSAEDSNLLGFETGFSSID